MLTVFNNENVILTFVFIVKITLFRFYVHVKLEMVIWRSLATKISIGVSYKPDVYEFSSDVTERQNINIFVCIRTSPLFIAFTPRSRISGSE